MIKNRLGSVCLHLLLFWGGTVFTNAQTTEFLYQGRLLIDGLSSSGSYDFIFGLYAENSGGEMLSTQTNTNVQVSNGLFQVPLDFGTAAFEEIDAWLEIGVRPSAGGPAFQLLQPRQALLPVPYAMQAHQAAAVPDSGLSPNVARLDGSAVFQDTLSVATATGDVRIVASITGPELLVQQEGSDDVLRVRRGLDIWPSSQGTSGGILQVRDTNGQVRVSLSADGPSYLNAGRVGVGVESPRGMLEVGGEVILGNATATDPSAGTLRWTGERFEAHDGTRWVPFASTAKARPVPLSNMVLIPAGSFVMGSFDDELDRELDEGPVTSTAISRSYWIGIYEVTQGDYARLMGDNPSVFGGDDRRPVENVSWEQAMAYCAALTAEQRAAGNLSDRYAYRLPTEAEWERASRAGTMTRFFFGDDPDYSNLASYAWYADNSGNATHPVGEKRPNAWGLYDTSGNVWEWCLDRYESSYPGGGVADPQGSATEVNRVLRGGSWSTLDRICRSARRFRFAPDLALGDFGFRVVLAEVEP